MSQELTRAPKPKQLLPRDLATNEGSLRYEGTSDDQQISAVVLRIYADGVLENEHRAQLTYSGGEASFSLSESITAGLTSYTAELYTEIDGALSLFHSADSLVVGDAYLMNGQSNAEAAAYVGSAAAYASPWIRSFGVNAYSDPEQVRDDLNWYLATGDSAQTPGFIGQWGLLMANKLVEANGIPVAILNGGQKGTPSNILSIFEYRRNGLDAANLTTNYGRLLYRARNAEIDQHIRAMFWYQGESDGASEGNTPIETYRTRFSLIRTHWYENYPSLEKVFLVQVRAGCGDPTPSLRNAQRKFADEFPDIVLMATTGIGGHDGCHFGFDPGYKQLGERMFDLAQRDLYDGPDTPGIDPPNISQVYYSSDNRWQVTVELRQSDDVPVIEDNAILGLSLLNESSSISTASATTGQMILQLGQPGGTEETLQYAEDRGTWTAWITSSAGVGMLVFDDEPIRSVRFDVPEIASVRSSKRGIVLNWNPVEYPDLAGYVLYRRHQSSGLIPIQTLPIDATTTTDNTVVLGETYYYAIAGLDVDQYESPLSEVVPVDVVVEVDTENDVPPASGTLSLSVFPQPCRENCRLQVSSELSQLITVSVVDILGRTVLPPIGFDSESAALLSARWGHTLPAGAYFLVARSSTETATHPFVIYK